MTHRLQPVRSEHGRFDSNALWLALLALVLLLAIIVAFMYPGSLLAPAQPLANAPAVPSATNPELSAFLRYQTAHRTPARAALLAHNPETRLLAPYQRAAALRDAKLLAENPELSAFRRYQTP